MNFWSLSFRFYLTMENRWVLDENYQFETTDVKTMKFWSLNSHFFFRIVKLWFRDEKF